LKKTYNLVTKTKYGKMKNIKMKIHFLILSLCVVISANAYTPPNEYKTIFEDKTVCYRNLRYGVIPDAIPDSTSDRLLDLYIPETTEKQQPLPIYFFVHGGGFAGGSKEAQLALFQKIANAGYAVVSINYRLMLKYNNPDKVRCSTYTQNGPGKRKFADGLNLAINSAVEDAQLALQWIHANAGKYRLDTNRLAVSGGSAGGITVLYLAFDSNQTVPPIKAVVNFWGALEDVSVIKTGKTLPAVLTYHGDIDNLIHVNFAEVLHKRLQETGDTMSILKIMEGKGHAQYSYISKYKTGEITDFLNKVL
jgi:acetyl esterase/lipase